MSKINYNICRISGIMLALFILISTPTRILFAQDSVAVDSNYSITPLKSHGLTNIGVTNSAGRKISKKVLPYINYTTLGDIIEQMMPIYPLNSGLHGSSNSFSAFGALPSQIQANFNGRSISNRYTQSFNMANFSPEFLETIEVLQGTDAVITESNSSGLLLNFQEIIYNTKSPYTKLWYSQSGGEFLSADGIFAQNMSKDINIFIGFRNQSADNLFRNSEYENWNVRGGVRWNLDTLTSISIVENFTNYYMQTNGGINPKLSEDVYDDITAVPYYANSKQQEFRHDLTATYSKFMATDSSRAVFGNLYFSNSRFENRLDTNMSYSDLLTNRNEVFEDSYFGAKGNYYSRLTDAFNYKVGGEAMYYSTQASLDRANNDGLKLSAFARIELIMNDNFRLISGAKITNYESNNYLSGGAKLRYIDSNSSASLDLSYSESLPNDYQLFLLNKEKHVLALADYKFSTGDYFIMLNVFSRYIQNPIVYNLVVDTKGKDYVVPKQADNQTSLGGTIAVGGEVLDNINLKLWNMSQYTAEDGTNLEIYPSFYSGVDVSYSRTVGRSAFTVGVDWSFSSKSKPMRLVSIQNVYVRTDEYSDAHANGLNLYATARLGTAFVKVTLQNALNTGYYQMAYYPMPGRNFRFSVHWDFFD